MIYPESFERKIGFDKIRQLIEQLCLSNMGKDYVQQMSFSVDFQSISIELDRVAELKYICQSTEPLLIEYPYDCRPLLEKLKIDGTFPEVEELLQLKRSLETIKGVYQYFKKFNEKYPRMWELSQSIKLFPYIENRIDSILTSQGKIKDNASPQLHQIRRDIHTLSSEISKRMHRILNDAKKDGITEADATLAIRDGRLVIPVISTFKRRIKGFIYDESTSGKTTYIEPSEVVELNNDLKELEYAERREIIKILTQLANDIRPYIDELLLDLDYLGKVDFIRAKALLAIDIQAIRPPMTNYPQIDWYNAIHPLLYLHLRQENKPIVPLNIRLNQQQRILVISGPNAGGKSVCLQTVGLIQYMLQCGLLVPIKETSDTGLFDNIFIDIGDEQSIENDLSTYSSHLLNMKFFLKNANDKTLFLIDEFGTGTEPKLGGAIAESILEALNQLRSFGVVTTHYTNLKHFAANTEGIVNGAMLFDTDRIQPLFQLMIGEPGSSFAFEIARKTGLPERILQQAAQKVGEQHIDYDRNLRQIIRDKHYWQQKRNQVKELSKKLEELTEKYKLELEQTNKLRKEIIARAKEEALALMNNANRTIENTIRSIKESQAEKEKTREARKNFEEIKQQIASHDASEDDKINRKIRQLQEREERKKNKKLTSDTTQEKETVFEKHKIEIGDKVKLYGQDTVGEVIDINGKSIMVAFGQMITTLPETRLEKISNAEYKKIQKNQTSTKYNTTLTTLFEKKQNFQLQLDVRGMRANEALEKVSQYIDDAIMVGVNEVRILHGKGNGVLRQLIRDYLKTIDLVKEFGDEHVDLGGAGITVVKFM